MKPNLTEVLPTSEVRAELSSTVLRFRKEGLTAAPVLFGSHRKPEGVLLPFSLFERLIPEIEEILLAERVRERLAEGAKGLPLEKLIKELGFKKSDFDA